MTANYHRVLCRKSTRLERNGRSGESHGITQNTGSATLRTELQPTSPTDTSRQYATRNDACNSKDGGTGREGHTTNEDVSRTANAKPAKLEFCARERVEFCGRELPSSL